MGKARPRKRRVAQQHPDFSAGGAESEPKNEIFEAALRFEPSTPSSVTRSEQLSGFYLPSRRALYTPSTKAGSIEQRQRS